LFVRGTASSVLDLRDVERGCGAGARKALATAARATARRIILAWLLLSQWI